MPRTQTKRALSGVKPAARQPKTAPLEAPPVPPVVEETASEVISTPKLHGIRVGDVTLVNLTDHDITIHSADNNGRTLTIPSSGRVSRIGRQHDAIKTIERDGVLVALEWGHQGMQGPLPMPERDTFYIVSLAVALTCPLRTDLLTPIDTLTDDRGRVIGCRALALTTFPDPYGTIGGVQDAQGGRRAKVRPIPFVQTAQTATRQIKARNKLVREGY
jgi:hypothetical protein